MTAGLFGCLPSVDGFRVVWGCWLVILGFEFGWVIVCFALWLDCGFRLGGLLD